MRTRNISASILVATLSIQVVAVIATAEAVGRSHRIFFVNSTADEKRPALAILEGAKIAHHRVHVITDYLDGRGITVGGTCMKAASLATNP